jgi:DMSO/TMAO reductase YedYZ molybdopterin-dependent catalytic subunit
MCLINLVVLVYMWKYMKGSVLMANQPLQRVLVTEQPYNAETPLSALLDELTPLELVYVRNHFEVPELDATNWSLEIEGAVKEPITIVYTELQKLSSEAVKITLECAGNGRNMMTPQPKGTPWGYGAISVVQFRGTPLSNVLEMAHVDETAVEVVFHGADQGEVEPGRKENFVRSLPMDVALNSDTILAWEMNGKPLTAKHGFPLRLVVPGWYGMASVKWLQKITLVSMPFQGFFQNEHYVYKEEEGTQEGEPVRQIRTRSLILDPKDGSSLSGDEIEIRGIAWSGYEAIAAVELSTDGGAQWLPANVEEPSSRYGVQGWYLKWKPETSGKYQLLCRATDTMGNSQPTSQVWNKLGYGNNGVHAISVIVR